MFICGRRSFRHNQPEVQNQSHVTTKRSKRSKTARRNPYAECGLDKFSALLADLEEKKQKIYNEMGSEDISVIQFVYSSDSEDLKPIVVKVKNKNPNNFLKQPPRSSISTAASHNSFDEIREEGEMVKRWNGDHHCFWLPVTMLLLILLFLAVNGRSFSILCTSVVWYILPSNTARRMSSSRTKSKKKPR